MRKTIITVTLLSLAAASNASAADPASKEEMIGVGSGALIGAVAGGPPGFILGAAFGALLGDTLHQKDEQIETLAQTVESKDQKVAELSTSLDSIHASNDRLGEEVTRLREIARPELIELLQAGIAMDLLFKTDETDVGPEADARIGSLARTLAGMPGISIRLDGFADERGDEAYNLDLSGKRVDTVRDKLIAAGIPADRIHTSAHGESPATEATPDGYALERKVSMTLYIDQLPAVASNP